MPENFIISTLNTAQFRTLTKSLSPQRIPIEQSPEWGKFDDALPGRTFLGSFRYDDQDGQLVALASATLYRQRGRDWIWIKHGPVFAHTPNTTIIKKMCSTLIAQFKNIESSQPIFIRLELPSHTKPLTLPFEHTMYDETVVINLLKSTDEILKEMSQGGRRGIRKAQKASISVVEVEPTKAIKNFEHLYYPLIHETAVRDGFGAHPAAYYQAMLQQLSPHAKLYVAQLEDKPLAWAITTEYDKQSLYYYGASNAKARELHAPYLLHWEIIQIMKARGNEIYDFMGIAGAHYPALANVTQFKLKFSKNTTKVPLTYDLPLKNTGYHILKHTIRLKRQAHKLLKMSKD